VAKKNHEPFVAGWTFWGIACVVLAPPSIYYCWTIVEDDVSRLIPVGMGFLLAGVGAGFVAWGANGLLQWIQRRRKLEVRKTAKKR
jgi:hypothetical protein